MFETNTNPFLQLFNPLLNSQGFLGSTPSFTPGYTFANSANAMMPNVQAAMSGLTGVGSAAGNVLDTTKDIAGGAGGAASGLTKAIPFIGLGLTAVSTLMSAAEAGKAADAQRAAQREAERALAEQKRLQEQNFYEALRAPTEAYDRQFREATAAGSEAINALAQDQRMLIGGVQGVQEATIEGQAKTREALADRLYNLDVMKAGAATQQADDLSKIAADEAQGAQIAAMAAEKAKIAQQQATLQGVGGLVTQGAGLIGTYGGLANAGDQLQTLLGGTSFAKPAATAQTDYAKILQGLMQDPNISQYISAKMK
jgi:hypothetical protein